MYAIIYEQWIPAESQWKVCKKEFNSVAAITDFSNSIALDPAMRLIEIK